MRLIWTIMLLLTVACNGEPGSTDIPACVDLPAVELLDGRLRVEGPTIYDASGRQVLLRG